MLYGVWFNTDVYMLFLKPISTLTFDDVEDFCRRFHENIRVEYKSRFDDSVKNKLPKVLSSFANSYGGILIIGINAPAGVPQEPYEGIVFPEREPGLTVQNICRDGIFPEIPLYTSLISSRVQGKAFLVVQVNESPKSPHAIENSTQVFVRSEGGTERTALADIARIERMLFRRADVSRRWNEFFTQSWDFAQSVNMNQKYAYREIRIGPLYPVEALMTREAIYDFLADPKRRVVAGFHFGQLLRSPVGALIARDQNVERFLNIGGFGTLHYVEPYYSATYGGEANNFLDLWSMAVPVWKMLMLSGALMEYANASCELRIETHLRNISGQAFFSNTNPVMSLPITTVATSVSASAQVSSQNLSGSASEITVDLMYQLRWPFGKEPAPTIDQVRPIVRNLLGSG
ncbi:MAG: ATP-binding protein [Halobacteriota archaeon]